MPNGSGVHRHFNRMPGFEQASPNLSSVRLATNWDPLLLGHKGLSLRFSISTIQKAKHAILSKPSVV